MNQPLHLSHILHQFLQPYKEKYGLTHQQWRVCQHIAQCRTVILGNEHWRCSECAHGEIIHCACRDRHCPRCQAEQALRWSEKQADSLLSCPYFHLVFTLPHELNRISYHHPKALYDALFQAVWQTIACFAQRKKGLEGQAGMTAVLHTWGQNLGQHIHLHCLIPGGVLRHGQWRGVQGHYLFAVKALSTVFRAKMLAQLKASNVDRSAYSGLYQKDWVVYSKPCLCQPDLVLAYLGRYTSRGPMLESRLESVDETSVRFQYKDYRDGGKKSLCLAGVEFLRRYLTHVLPKGFVRVRHFGFLANGCRKRALAVIRPQLPSVGQLKKRMEEVKRVWPCPECHQGTMQLVRIDHPPRVSAVMLPMMA